jgi:hypothetical protein
MCASVPVFSFSIPVTISDMSSGIHLARLQTWKDFPHPSTTILNARCRTPVGQMIIFGKDPAGGNKLVS